VVRLRASLPAVILVFTSCSAPLGIRDQPRSYIPANGWPTIVCLGDSLTAGDAAPVNQSYPAWLQKRLTASGYHYRVINAGVSGTRVADGLKRLRGDVFRFHPKVVVVELGGNDPGKTPTRVWQRQLSELVARVQRWGAQVVLGGLDEPGLGAVYRIVAAQRNVPLVWFTARLWSSPGLWGDAHHPNGHGYRVVMETFWPVLVRLLTRSG